MTTLHPSLSSPVLFYVWPPVCLQNSKIIITAKQRRQAEVKPGERKEKHVRTVGRKSEKDFTSSLFCKR